MVTNTEASDYEMSFCVGVRENEIQIYSSLMKGYADYLEGDVVEASEAEKAIMEEKGWLAE